MVKFNSLRLCFVIPQHKLELLSAVRDLEQMGMNLFASMGTADFYTEHNIKVQICHFV